MNSKVLDSKIAFVNRCAKELKADIVSGKVKAKNARTKLYKDVSYMMDDLVADTTEANAVVWHKILDGVIRDNIKELEGGRF